MTVKELLKVLDTDEYFFINFKDDTCEIIRDYEEGSHKAIKKYYGNIVVDIKPCGNAVEIRYV